jgi:hypothetical protein
VVLDRKPDGADEGVVVAALGAALSADAEDADSSVGCQVGRVLEVFAGVAATVEPGEVLMEQGAMLWGGSRELQWHAAVFGE